jgi:hypothetical protein
LKHSGLVQSAALVVALASAGMALAPSQACAQDPVVDDVSKGVNAFPKGTVGLGLIGAELGFLIPALAGLTDWYWYVIFPVIGAAGGAVGGWYATDRPGRGNAAVALLATGMALILPTMVLTAWKTSYQPERDPDVIQPGGMAAAEAQQRLRDTERQRRAGAGVLRRSDDGWLLGAPGLQMRVNQDPKEQVLLGMAPPTELHVPVLTGVF